MASNKLRLWIPRTDYGEQWLQHREEAEKSYRDLAARGEKNVRVGMEASGHARWFERLLTERSSSCGSATQRRFEPSACKRKTDCYQAFKKRYAR